MPAQERDDDPVEELRRLRDRDAGLLRRSGSGLMFSDGGVLGTRPAAGCSAAPTTARRRAPQYQGMFGALGWAGVPLLAKFFFELVFCGTSATIVSGSVNERMKYSSFLVFSLVLTAVIYPIAGHWVWGGGFLARAGMTRLLRLDGGAQRRRLGGARRASSCVGPRLGRYPAGGKPATVPGHNMGYVFAGRHDPLARLVRVQPGLDDGRRPGGHRAHRGHDQPGGLREHAGRDALCLVAPRQAGLLADGQRLPGRAWCRSPRPARSSRPGRRSSSARSPA